MDNIVTVFIEADASVTFLDSPLTKGFNLGPSVTRRYSSVEPDNAVLRLVFVVLRWLFSDTSAVSNWTRNWPCFWRVHIKNGPVLTWEDVDGFPKSCLSWWYICDGHKAVATWRNRQEAIDAEHAYFNIHGVNHDCN